MMIDTGSYDSRIPLSILLYRVHTYTLHIHIQVKPSQAPFLTAQK